MKLTTLIYTIVVGALLAWTFFLWKAMVEPAWNPLDLHGEIIDIHPDAVEVRWTGTLVPNCDHWFSQYMLGPDGTYYIVQDYFVSQNATRFVINNEATDGITDFTLEEKYWMIGVGDYTIYFDGRFACGPMGYAFPQEYNLKPLYFTITEEMIEEWETLND